MPDKDHYEPLTFEWGKLFPMTLEIKVDGPFKRRIEDLTLEVARGLPELPPVMWGIVVFGGFMLLRKTIREEGSFVAGLQKVLEDSLQLAAMGY